MASTVELSLKTLDIAYSSRHDFIFINMPKSVIFRLPYDFNRRFLDVVFRPDFADQENQGDYQVLETEERVIYTMPYIAFKRCLPLVRGVGKLFEYCKVLAFYGRSLKGKGDALDFLKPQLIKADKSERPFIYICKSEVDKGLRPFSFTPLSQLNKKSAKIDDTKETVKELFYPDKASGFDEGLAKGEIPISLLREKETKAKILQFKPRV